MNWYVIHTKARWEIKIYNALLDRGFEAYCPTYTAIRQWSDRKKKIQTPYFNRYVFIRVSESNRNEVFRIPGVLRYLMWQGNLASVRQPEMKRMKEYLDGDVYCNPGIEPFVVGDNVTFKRGLLKDHEALVEEIGQKYVRLVLPALGCKIITRTADLTF